MAVIIQKKRDDFAVLNRLEKITMPNNIVLPPPIKDADYSRKLLLNNLNIRRYSSSQLLGSRNPCASIGYIAISQFSFFSSINR